MRALSILALLLAAGCSHTQVNYGSTANTAAGSTTVSSSGGVLIQGGVPAFLILGLAAIAQVSDNGASRSSVAPEMLPDKVVAERDCTKPIEDWSANLKCR